MPLVRLEIDMRFAGWNFDQWAVAKARHDDLCNGPVIPSIDGMIDLQKWWRLSGWPDPLSHEIAGAEYQKDIDWAKDAFFSVAHCVYHG